MPRNFSLRRVSSKIEKLRKRFSKVAAWVSRKEKSS